MRVGRYTEHVGRLGPHIQAAVAAVVLGLPFSYLPTVSVLTHHLAYNAPVGMGHCMK